MRVELQAAALLAARSEAERLAEAVESGARRADAASPILLPSLAPLPAKATWLREQVPMLDDLAALAILLDDDGDGHAAVTVPRDAWSPSDLVREAGDQRFGPGFVEATGLTGRELASLLQTLGSVGRDVPEGSVMTAAELRDFVIDHPAVAAALQATVPLGDGPAGTLRSLTGAFVTAPGGVAAVYEQRRLDARDLFEGLSPEHAAILAMTYPSIVGNLAGVPFANRAHANTVNVVAALADERRELAGLRDQHEENQGDWDFLGRNNDDLEGPIEDLERRICLYESILSDGRSIVYFDPAGDGAIAELHGSIDAGTDNVGVLVPGTTADLANYDKDLAPRSRGFQNGDSSGGLTMISWMGGDLPDSIATDAPDPSYSLDLGPRLADFSRDLDLEISRSDGAGARVTVAGHSYGGAVVGRSELSGLVADRVLHIESAGMGHDVHDAGDLPSSQSGVDRYSMTAPDDFISLTQGVQVGDIGHGADPDDFAGTVRLHTGDKVDGTPNTGIASHSGVFQQRSDAWDNMLAVFRGGEIETYRSPHYEHVYTGHGVATYQDGWNDDGERIDIE
ncbi:alpha/beta hydrolase [Aeromicrobium sp. 179-A 4D2 NHS]|uniref:alpha/beta hydrolase n=1 Tax=Aeromicrobium sp. 179-A 4D2 NHS TaxID=3142375 RepID=UPI0039A20FB4